MQVLGVASMIAKAGQFRDLSRDELVKLFASAWHECRLTGMLILVDQYELAAKPNSRNRDFECREFVEFYLANLDAVNKWDLVDSTAPKIFGAWLVENCNERGVLDSLVITAVPKASKVAKDGGTLYTLKPEEKEGQFCGVFPYMAHVQLSFAQGASLDDPDGLLEGGGKFRRHLTYKSLDDVDAKIVKRFTKAASKL